MKSKYGWMGTVFWIIAAPSLAAAAQPAGGTVPVYDSTQVAFARYSVIKRVGADGVINLTCFDQTDRIFNPAGYFCYGNAIRLTK